MLRKIKSFFKKMQECLKIQIIFFLVCMLILATGYFYIKEHLEYKKIVNSSVMFEHEISDMVKVEIDDEKIKFFGWTLYINSIVMDVKIFLDRTDGNQEILLETNDIESGYYYFEVEGKTSLDDCILVVDRTMYEQKRAKKSRNN